jgi:cyclophilin family peptidyl-prolyl cis-trans isomerase
MRLRSLPFALVALSCARTAYVPAPLTSPDDPRFAAAAADSFDVEVETTRGTMLVRARRHWSPNGVDRLYALVRNHYFDSVGFHRVIRGYVAQFGIHGDPAVTTAWRGRSVPDDTVRVVNQRGTLSFARGGPNSRTVQLYFNLVDNTPRLDTLNRIGFPPVGQVIRGIEILDALNSEYSSPGPDGPPRAPPDQGAISRDGNAYLRANYPRLDYIVRARLVREWR